MYGPVIMEPKPKGEQLISSGVDVWNKSVRYPIMEKFIKNGNYHKDHGEGMDNYKVGPGRGCGGFGVYNDGGFHLSQNWATQKHIADGPVRTQFEVTFKTWDCGNGAKISESRTMSLDAGSHMTRFESVFTVEGAEVIKGGPGLDISEKKAHNGIITKKADQGWIANYEPEQKDAGSIGTAIVIPGKATIETDSMECIYLLDEITPGKPYVWYAGSCWSGAGDFVNAEYWTSYVSSFAEALAHPLEITVK
jgi:hypothetical protein